MRFAAVSDKIVDNATIASTFYQGNAIKEACNSTSVRSPAHTHAFISVTISVDLQPYYTLF